jgi:hypothetical protein
MQFKIEKQLADGIRIEVSVADEQMLPLVAQDLARKDSFIVAALSRVTHPLPHIPKPPGQERCQREEGWQERLPASVDNLVEAQPRCPTEPPGNRPSLHARRSSGESQGGI